MYETRNLSIMLKHMSRHRDRILQIEMAKGKDVTIAHRKYSVLNDDFEDILDTLGDSKEIENDFEEDSESVTLRLYIMHMLFLSLVSK